MKKKESKQREVGTGFFKVQIYQGKPRVQVTKL